MNYSPAQRSALTIAMVTSFLGPFLASSVNIALPVIESDLGLNSVQLSWIINAFLLSSAILLLPAGKLADMFGQVQTFRCGIVFITLATFLCGTSTSWGVLLIFRCIQGIGASMTMTTGASMLVSLFPSEQRGRILGMNVAAVYLGLSSGPLIGGILTQHMGWRSIFFISSALGLFAMFLAFYVLKANRNHQEYKRIDLTGSGLYALMLFALVFGATRLPEFSGWMWLIASLGCFLVFIRHQSRQSHPMVDIQLYRSNRLFAFSNISALINYSGTYAVVLFLSLYLQKVKLMSPQEAGFLLIAQPLVQALFSPFTGYLSDKIPARILSTIGMFLNGSGLLVMSTFHQQTSSGVITMVLIVMGLGFALFSSPNMNSIMGSVGKHQLGVASGTAATMRIVGQIISMTIASFLFSLEFKQTPIAEVDTILFIATISKGFVALGILCYVGIYFSYSRGK